MGNPDQAEVDRKRGALLGLAVGDALGAVLCGMIHGIDRDEVLAPNWQPLLHLKELHTLHPEVAEVTADSFR